MSEDRDLKKLLVSSLNTIEAMEETLDRLHQPIAIVSMACRFPGGNNTPEDFWKFLNNGGDGISLMPENRWNNKAFYNTGKDYSYYVQEAGFISQDIKTFDARLFGISPKEVEEMDPQQRILLEVSWEIFERAGYTLPVLKDKNIGVFIGAIGSEFATLPKSFDQIGNYASTGMITNILSGRLAYLYGLTGPAVTIDTACSSSLVSMHLACKSIQRGECDMALVGGVNIMLSPIAFTMLCRMQALAKDGRCKSFSARGDGYGRGEGCGLVLVKPLEKALAEGDNILAVYHGSAINQDGPSSGLTVPSGPAQHKLILSALKDAQLDPQDISAMEAHGTGTPLGDPIEFDALTAAYGVGRTSENPLLLTSVKANIGHLEGAAGIAGIIKAILCLQHQHIPPQINLEELNPRINLDKLPATITKEGMPWNTHSEKRYIGISSFGFSGTNSHVILGEAPVAEESKIQNTVLQFFTLSAKDKDSLETITKSYLEFLTANESLSFDDLCYTVNQGRNHFNYRVCFTPKNNEELKENLNRFVQENAFETVEDLSLEKPLEIAYNINLENFPLPYSEYLLDNIPSYKRIFLESVKQLPTFLEENVKDYLNREKSLNLTDDHEKIIKFLHSCVLMLWLKALNVKPTVMISQGEGLLIAAFAAEIMELQLALDYFVFYFFKIKPDNIIEPKGNFGKQKFIIIHQGTGEEISQENFIPSRFLESVKHGTAFNETIFQKLQENDINFFIDFSNEDKLTENLKSTIPSISISKNDDYREVTGKLFQALYMKNLEFNWDVFYKGLTHKHYNLPTYPFHRKKYWLNFQDFLKASSSEQTSVSSNNPFEIHRVQAPGNSFLFLISQENLPDVVDTNGILHVGHYYTIIRKCIIKMFSKDIFQLTDLHFHRPVYIQDNGITEVSVEFSLLEKENGYIKLHVNLGDGKWALAMTSLFSCLDHVVEPLLQEENKQAILHRCINELSGDVFYQDLEENTLSFGSSVKWIEKTWYKEDEIFAEMRMPQNNEISTIDNFELPYHYGILDACAQLFNAIQLKNLPPKFIYMASSVGNFTFSEKSYKGKIICYCTLEKANAPSELQGSFYIYTSEGEFLASATQIKLMKVNVDSMAATLENATTPSSTETNTVDISKFSTEDAIIDELKKLLSSVLGISLEDISVGDSLIHLGIDSLSSTQIKTKILNTFTADIPLETLISGVTIKDLVKSIFNIISSKNPTVSEEVKPLGYSKDKKLWLSGVENPNADISIICFPYGGGSAGIYKYWRELCPDNVAIYPIQFPGRENRIKEEAIDNMDEMISALEEVLSNVITKPFILYGHSMGGLVAYCLAKSLLGKGNKFIKHLCVGGYSCPIISPNPFYADYLKYLQPLGIKKLTDIKSLSTLSNEEILTVIKQAKIGFDVQNNFELARLLVSILFADMKVVESYEYNNDSPLSIPITAFHGIQDDRVTAEDMQLWKNLTVGEFHYYEMSGDHFFIDKGQNGPEVFQYLLSYVKSIKD